MHSKMKSYLTTSLIMLIILLAAPAIARQPRKHPKTLNMKPGFTTPFKRAIPSGIFPKSFRILPGSGLKCGRKMIKLPIPTAFTPANASACIAAGTLAGYGEGDDGSKAKPGDGELAMGPQVRIKVLRTNRS